MSGRSLPLIIVLAVIGIGLLAYGSISLFGEESGAPAAPSTPKPTTSPTPTATAAEAKLLKEWEGTGMQKTESFTITKAPWAISWANNPQGTEGAFQVILLDATKPNTALAFPASTNQKGADITYMQQTGTFELQIIAQNTQWTIQVWARQ